MKLVKVFGLVVALHVVPLTAVLLIQGCQSKPGGSVGTAEEAAAVPIEAAPENWSNQSADYPTTEMAPVQQTPIVGLTPAERTSQRSQPMRPPNPESFYATSPPAPQTVTPSPAVPPTTTYTVVPGDSFWRISREFGTTITELQRLNPGIKGASLHPGDVLVVPAGGTATLGTGTTQRVTSSASSSTYVVRAGDSLSSIAARNGTTIAALRGANNLRTDVIQVGAILNIPEATRRPEPEARVIPTDAVTVVVQRGDTLSEIAAKYDVTVRELMGTNGIDRPESLRAGDTLVIPGFSAMGTGRIPNEVAPPAPPPSEPAMLLPPQVITPQAPPSEPARSFESNSLDAPVVPIDDPTPTP